MKNTKNKKIIGIVVILSILGLLLYAGLSTKSDAPLFITYDLYDINGNPIETSTFSIVGGIEGVHSMSFNVNVKNVGSTPIIVTLGNIQPEILREAFPAFGYTWTILPNETIPIPSSSIDVSELESMAQPVIFTVDVEGTYSYAGVTKNLPTKSGSMSIMITGDPVPGFEIDFSSSNDLGIYCIPGEIINIYPTHLEICNDAGTGIIIAYRG